MAASAQTQAIVLGHRGRAYQPYSRMDHQVWTHANRAAAIRPFKAWVLAKTPKRARSGTQLVNDKTEKIPKRARRRTELVNDKTKKENRQL